MLIFLRYYPCPVIYEDARFDLGGTLAESFQRVYIGHKNCYDYCLKGRGASFSTFWIVNAIKVTADAKTFEDVAADPSVASIVPDPTYEILPDSVPTQAEVDAAVQQAASGTLGVEWNIQNIGAPAVWSTYGDRGEGIVVATIDTGVQYNHPALVNSYRGNLGGGLFDHNYDWYDPSNVCGSPSVVPCDNNGHGTHTMGTIVGDDGGSNQIGVAPGARWLQISGQVGVTPAGVAPSAQRTR